MSGVYIVGAKRTPIGSFQGVLKDVHVARLGASAITAALEHAGISADAVDQVFMGHVLQGGAGQAPARQAMRYAGIPDSTPAVTVNKVCGSGLMTVIMGTWAIRAGDADIVVAGGMENMSQAPYALKWAREGARMGDADVIDLMIHDGLWDPYDNVHMGQCGELCAEEYNLTREAQDEYAIESYKRAIKATEDGIFSQEIVPVTYQDRKKGEVKVDRDEEPFRVKFEKIPSLRPAFKKDGTITAANASSINDGAAAVVLASEGAVKKYNLKPLAKLLGYTFHAQEPKWFTTAPVEAMKKLSERTGISLEKVDVFEINEAFSVVPMVAIKELQLPHEKVNILGGAVSLGHPIGASGTRIVVTMLSALEVVNGKVACAAICIGGGEAIATLWERTD